MAPLVEPSRVPRRKSALGMRIPLALILLTAGCGLIAHLAFSDERARAASKLEVRALGHTLMLGGEAPALQAKALAGAFLREPIALVFEDQKVTRPRQELGVTVARTGLGELLREAADPRSPLRKLHQQRQGRAPLTLPIPAQLEGTRAQAWLRSFAARIDTPARQARIDPSGTITPPSPGRQLDVEATLDALQDAVFRGNTVVTPVVRALPAEPSLAFEQVDLQAVLGSFESDAAPDDAARRQLLTQIARALDGALIAPGAVLDFAAQAGLTRGMAPLAMGPVSLEGDRAEAAFTQVAGVVYASALFAGLPVLEQHPRASPLASMELGLESLVDAQHNLRVRNDRSVPIALTVSVRDGRVRAALRGPASEAREVELSRLVEVAAPFPEIERPEAGMAQGARAVIQRGLPSLHVSLLRTIRGPNVEPSEHTERDVTYLPTARVVKVGTGGAGGATVKADTRPEYLADEHLALTMRPGFELPEETARRVGRTGTPGWTSRDIR
ncbi:MAG TPA: VanW family protein [Polyangiales bacterium]|nr:VanW family protein [Polyangiales bacterium]